MWDIGWLKNMKQQCGWKVWQIGALENMTEKSGLRSMTGITMYERTTIVMLEICSVPSFVIYSSSR